MATQRTGALELAVLGLLHDEPLHGYELRKQVTALLGWGSLLSYGSLYPCLKRMARRGLITQHTGRATATRTPARANRRARIVYHLTAGGQDSFAAALACAGPRSWEDDSFDVRLAFFSETPADTRLSVLEGRRARLRDKLAVVRESPPRDHKPVDPYICELHRHSVESIEREVQWLGDLIQAERAAQQPPSAATRRDSDTTTRRPSRSHPHPSTRVSGAGDPSRHQGGSSQK